MCSAKNKQYKIIDRNEEMKMTNKQWQTIVAICITFTIVFSVISLITMDLLLKRCDTLEEVLYDTKATANYAQELASVSVALCEECYNEHTENYNKLLEMIEEKEDEPEVKVEVHALNYDYNYVLRVVAAECRGEPIEGQMAVAQCIRETANATGMTPEEVVKQVNPNGTRQYSVPTSMENVNDNVREACERVFINGESAVDEPIRYFYSIRNGGYSKWHENSLDYVITIGNHKFFKAK